MSSSSTGRCCVCGTSTAQRCGACSEAGFDLFFCSRVHQKLVHFAHKKVCGKNAKPFRFPPITKEEASLVIAHASEVYGGLTSLTSQIMQTLKCSKGVVPTILNQCTQDEPPFSAAVAAHVLCRIRCQLASIDEPNRDLDNPYGAFPEPFQDLSSFVLSLNALVVSQRSRARARLPSVEPGLPVHEDLHVRIYHQYLVFVALAYRRGRMEGEASELARVEELANASMEVFKALQQEVEKEDAAVGRALGASLSAGCEGERRIMEESCVSM